MPSACRNFGELLTVTVVSPHNPQRYKFHREEQSLFSLQFSHTSRMGATAPRATLLLLSAFLTLTQTKNQSFTREYGSGGK